MWAGGEAKQRGRGGAQIEPSLGAMKLGRAGAMVIWGRREAWRLPQEEVRGDSG